MKTASLASLASLFHPRWCPIVKVPMNSHDRATKPDQKCGPIVKVHMNSYNRAAWQAAKDVIEEQCVSCSTVIVIAIDVSEAIKVAPRVTAVRKGRSWCFARGVGGA